MECTQFKVIIDYDPNADNPERIFLALSELVAKFSYFDNLMCESLSINIKNKLYLEKIEQGSIVSTFRQIIENVDDDSLSKLDWKSIIGHMLVKGKYVLLDFLDKKNDNKRGSIEQLQSDLFELTKDVKDNPLQVNNYIPRANLLKCVDGINKSIYKLNKNDKVKYVTQDGTTNPTYNLEFDLFYQKNY